MHFLSDFGNLNEQKKRETYPMTNINEILLKQKSFKYDMPIDLNMGYSFFLYFFWSGHRGSKAYSLWDGVVPKPEHSL